MKEGGSDIVFRVLLFITVTVITYLGTKLSFIEILFYFCGIIFPAALSEGVILEVDGIRMASGWLHLLLQFSFN